MQKAELLAPAGSFETLKAVIEAGCDAVYLGGYQFGARSYAHNFSNEEIKKAIQYAHLYGVRVFVTVNTIIYEEEIEECMQYIDFLHKNNVDAILIQDIGLLDLVRKTYPNLEVHASTQMHIHNLEGVQLMQELGVKRVVLARETPLELIKQIKENTQIELEVFVHGALCFSYSGQCLISSLIGRRSGNRGTCAGSCRQKYTLMEKNHVVKDGYILSMKDLNTLDNLENLLKIGVSSLKIEGRTKRVEYAYWIVKLYRKAIDSYYEKGKIEITEEEIRIMKELFNREFTKGFLNSASSEEVTNPYRPNHMGVELGVVVKSNKKSVEIKLNNTLNVQDGIRFLLKDEDYGCVVNNIKIRNCLTQHATKNQIIEISIAKEIPVGTKVVKTTNVADLKNINKWITANTRKVKITAKCFLKAHEKMTLTLSDGKNEVTAQIEECPDIPIHQETSDERILLQLSKLGDTVYTLENIQLEKEEPLFVSIKALNDLRRKAVDLLNEKRLYKTVYKKESANLSVPDFKSTAQVDYWIHTEEQYEKIKEKNIHFIFVQEEKLYQKLKKDKRVVLKLSNVQERLKDISTKVLVGELGSVYKYKDFLTDTTLNVVNSYAVAFLHRLGAQVVTLSHELSDTQIELLIQNYRKRYNKNPNLSLMIYGREIVMTSKVNLNAIYHTKESYLLDRFKNRYPIRVIDKITYIYNYQIRSKEAAKYFSLGIHFVRYDILMDEELIDK